MIQLLSHGYSKEDFEFLKEILARPFAKNAATCSEYSRLCLNCPNRRACFDLDKFIKFINKECEK